MTQLSTDEIRAALADLVHQIVEVPVAAVEPASRLVDDLGIDSLSLVELLTGVEEHLGVRISDADVARLGTVDDVVRIIAAAV